MNPIALPKLRRGPRLRAEHVNRMVEAIQASTPTIPTPGFSTMATPNGSASAYLDPLRATWCFVTHVTFGPLAVGAESIIAHEAERTPVGNWKPPSQTRLISGHPAPNYARAHFEKFVVSATGIEPTDLACLYVGGYFVPDFRMLLVDPAPESELCEDSTPVPASGNCEGCGGN